MVDNYAAFFNCTSVVRASGLCNGPDLKLYSFWLVWAGASFLLLVPGDSSLVFFSFVPGFQYLLGAQGSPSSGSLLNL